ncbi:MAG: hypothetical protein JJU29_20380 [Verrucomicrobia bacterium]|nr:hypothetical protein [Verrucomicrobiota bacterium]MCH8513047.1 hypothetical protein [Kiritimatiellia bacterium]
MTTEGVSAADFPLPFFLGDVLEAAGLFSFAVFWAGDFFAAGGVFFFTVFEPSAALIFLAPEVVTFFEMGFLGGVFFAAMNGSNLRGGFLSLEAYMNKARFVNRESTLMRLS